MAKESNSTIARALLADINAGKTAKEVAISLAAYLIEERRLGDVNAILRVRAEMNFLYFFQKLGNMVLVS
jgi:hypothetical protein